eukprot:scaffold49171_cov37-Cyclotella_meneghiniana.AAC.1
MKDGGSWDVEIEPVEELQLFQEMIGWQDHPEIPAMITCRGNFTTHNIVNSKHPTTRASSAPRKYYLRSSCLRRFAPRGLLQLLYPLLYHVSNHYTLYGA